MPVGQLGIFLGVWIDSHNGRLKLTDAKWEKLLAELRMVMTWEEATPRMASKVRGKLIETFRVHHHDPAVCGAFQCLHRWGAHRR